MYIVVYNPFTRWEWDEAPSTGSMLAPNVELSSATRDVKVRAVVKHNGYQVNGRSSGS